jgi:hypothetical protein
MSQMSPKDLAALDDAWTSPFSYVTKGEDEVYARYLDFVKFKGLRAAGWVRTRVSRVEELPCDDTSAVIDSTLTRLAADDTEIASGTLIFVLVRVGDGCKLRVGFNLASFSTGKSRPQHIFDLKSEIWGKYRAYQQCSSGTFSLAIQRHDDATRCCRSSSTTTISGVWHKPSFARASRTVLMLASLLRRPSM